MKVKLDIFIPGAKKRLDEFCEKLNFEAPSINVTRVANGEEITYQRKQKAISDGAQMTAKVLIHSYAKSLKDHKSSVPAEWDREELPGLRINSPKMASLRKNITDRTIRNHIRELKAVGIITKYVYHGSKSDYELWMNEEILFGGSNLHSIEMPLTDTSSFTFNAINGTNFPHIQEKNLWKQKDITTSNVDKSPTWQHNTTEPTTWQHFNGNPVSLGEGCDENGNRKSGGAGAKNVDNFVENTKNRWNSVDYSAPDFEKLHPYFKNAVKQFWLFAAKTLWPDRRWSESEQLRAKDEISRIFTEIILLKPHKNQFQEWLEELYNSVIVAEKYYTNHPDRYPGLPFTAGKALGYFDRENPKGFTVARQWRLKNKAENREEYGRRVIKSAFRHLSNHRIGKAPKMLQCRSYAEVVLYYDAKMKKFGTKLHAEFRQRINIL